MGNDQDKSLSEAEGTVLMIGSGVTGLALAQGLKKAGIPCIVFEKHPANLERSRDWNMGLHWGASVLESLIPSSLWEQLQSVQVDPNTPLKDEDTLSFLNAATGERMGAITVSKWYRLRRSKVLAEALDIRYEKALVDISYAEDGSTATAHFADGTTSTGRLVVGADGARSAVPSLPLGQ